MRGGRLVGIITVVALVALIVAAVLKNPGGLTGIEPGTKIAAVRGAAGAAATWSATPTSPPAHTKAPPATCRPAACAAAQVLNICELYERGPVVLALFVDGGSCPTVLGEMQALKSSFPGVHFAAVAIKGAPPRPAHA